MNRIAVVALLGGALLALTAIPVHAQSCTGNGCGQVKLKEGVPCAVFIPNRSPKEVRVTLSIPNVKPGIVKPGQPYKPLLPPKNLKAEAAAAGITGGCVKHRDFSYTANGT